MPRMEYALPEELVLIAGKGVYPRLLAESAKRRGVKRLVAVAFRRETDRAIERVADETIWLHLGQLSPLREGIRSIGARYAVMVGQITPTHLFNLRLDKAMLNLIQGLPRRNAHTIFGAFVSELAAIGVEALPASTFMEDHMPEAGLLSARSPTDGERADIELGLEVARATSALEIGQTVVIKEGTILAVEAFEGTDKTLLRAGRLGGPGAVVVKVAKSGHDMRFDIPVIGDRTMRTLKKAKSGVLAVEAGRAILLEREKLIAMANAMNLCMLVLQHQVHEQKGANG